MLREIWARVTTTQPELSPALTLVVAVLALVLVTLPTSYRVVRHAVTVAHEAGHAVVALAVGRRLSGIRLHSDTSGVTLSRGRPRGPGMIATLAAGYPAPALVALAGAVVLGQGYAVALLWGVVLVSAVLVLSVRNLYGLWVLLVLGGGVGLASWTLPEPVLTWIAHLLVWTTLLAAPRSAIELARRGRSRAPTSDAAQLAALTGLPTAAWVAVFLLVTVGAAVLGARLLLPL